MTNRQTRDLQRWLHLAFGFVLGAYVYSPWGTDPAFALAVKAVVIPVLVATGLLLWKGPQLRAWLRPSAGDRSIPPGRPPAAVRATAD